MRIAAEDLSVDLGGVCVVRDVALSLTGGALVGIIGPNGAGKSTLARALLGLVPAAAGRATIDGADVGGMTNAAIARRVAYLPQAVAVHWPLAVSRLVGLGRLPHLGPFSRIADVDRAAIGAAMHATGTAALADRIATELSGGERARVMLARALATGAPALIADEPLASLDPGHQIDIMALLQGQAQAGALVVVVLHDLGIAARFCDRLLLMDRGRLVADGTPAAVLTDEALAAVYGIAAWRGEVDGRPLLVPVERAIDDAPRPRLSAPLRQVSPQGE